MPGTKLILIDGLPGSGKSTTAQFIAHQLRKHQLPARWFYEQETPHPVHVPETNDPARFVEQSLRSWQAFAERAQQEPTITILESSFLQNTVLPLLAHDADTAMIDEYVATRQESIHVLEPVLIYFQQADVAAAMRRICAARGVDWQRHFTQVLTENAYSRRMGLRGFAGALIFNQHYRVLCDRLFGRLPGPKLAIENGVADWPRDYAQIMDLLALPLLPDLPIDAQEAAPWIGTYTDERTGFTCDVCFDAGHLVVNHLWWPADCFTPLLSEGGDRFAIRGAPLELCFKRDASGNASLHVEGPWQSCVGAGVGVGTVLRKCLHCDRGIIPLARTE